MGEGQETLGVDPQVVLRQEVAEHAFLGVDVFAGGVQLGVVRELPGRRVDEKEPRFLKQLPNGGIRQPVLAILLLVVVPTGEHLRDKVSMGRFLPSP